LGLVHALEKRDDEAQKWWRKGLELGRGDEDVSTKLLTILYTGVLDGMDAAIRRLREIVSRSQPSWLELDGALQDANVLARLPNPTPGLKQAGAVLSGG